jgi:SAM-dependent methyltransferase
MARISANYYNRKFFAEQREQGLRSARVVVPLIVEMLQPHSVVDVGCGVGAWLAAFHECGVADTLGIDGEWAAGFHDLESNGFLQHDLSIPIELTRRFDLVVCLEVAEHLQPACAGDLIKSLIRLGDVVLFSAAVPYQGGTLHLNEQWPDYWAAMFESHGYRTIDAVRPRLWNHPSVDWWYVQNTLLFVDAARSASVESLSRRQPVEKIAQLCVVHPRHYLEKARLANIGLREALTMIPGLTKEALGRRVLRLRRAIRRTRA